MCRPSRRRCRASNRPRGSAIVAPPGTPAAIVDKINADVNEALRQPEIKDKLANLSAEVLGGTPQAMAAYMKEEIERWLKVIKAANVKLE